MRYLITASLLLLGTFSLKAQNKLLKKAQYQLINNYLGANNLRENNFKLDISVLPFKNNVMVDVSKYVNRKALRNRNILLQVDVDTLLNVKDYEFMLQQIELSSGIDKLDVKLLKLPAEKLLLTDNRTNRERSIPAFVTYKTSLPLFSCSYNVALLYVENHCGGECGSGDIYIMKKQKDGSWKRLGSVGVWLS